MSSTDNAEIARLQRAVVFQRLQAGKNQRRAVHARSPILPADRGAALPLSWAQQRLWFLDQLDHAAGAAYHMSSALKLQGVLDRAALQRTLDRVVARHESLRTTFVTVNGTPQQVIAPEGARFALLEQDLSHLDRNAQAQALSALGMEEARSPFDLQTGPLIRGRLLRLSPEEHVLLVTQHHIISDGWSMGVLVREVSVLYTAFSQGQADPLPALPIQYVDYAAWQRQWLQGEVLERQLGYWREHLSGAPALLELPTDRPRPAMQSHAGGVVPVQFSAELTAGLHALSKRHGTTLFMTLLAGWSVLLSRLSGQSEVVIGTPVANRQRTELEGLIGFFVNTLALRVDVGSDPTVADLLSQVKGVTLGGYSHQDLPFEQVVEALQPARSLGHTPLFQAMLSLNNTSSDGGLSLPGLTLSGVETPHVTTHFDLTLLLRDVGEGLVGGIEYASDLFDEATVTRWAGHFECLLTAMVADADQRVRALPLLSAEERHQVLAAFNDTATAYPQDGLIHGLFEAQAARTPEATALVHEAQTLSYAELNRRANQVAHRLIGLGVKPDDRVAICAERSVEMVVGLLGVLKAGGAYVPLDPTYPRDRLAYMLEDSAPVALVTQSGLMDTVSRWLPEDSWCPLVVVDGTAAAELASQPTHDPGVQTLRADHLAYVIYTSGSTGKPKGVMVEHRSVLNLWAALEVSAFGPVGDIARVGLNAAISFDASIQSITQLLSGRCVVLIPQHVRTDGAALLSYAGDHGLDALDCTPIQLDLLLAEGLASGSGYQPRMVLVGGEAVSSRAWEQLEQSRRTTYFNVYGPTECTVDATIGRIDDSADRPHIGRPLANTQIYILDERLQPVPLGVIGELYIGGAGVARGYLNRPELTAERFVRDPFSTQPDARMYKTGDLGRWLPDGTIEYLGRNDFQVKIRGFRIELGEIEAKLSACAGVREAVVLAREDVEGDKRLVAYVVPQSGITLSASELREALSRELAEYMVPSAFVSLEALPLTPNGKLDRKALPAPDQSSVVSRAYEAPVGEVERTIAEIWQELLGLERVGRHDHFFELGGHSLLAVQSIARLRQALSVDIGLRELFAEPTLSALARTLSGAEEAELSPIPPADRGAALPLSWAQQRLWFLDQLDHAAGAAYHMPSALKLQGALDRTALQRTLDRVVARHENLRTTLVTVDGMPQQVIAPEDIGFALMDQDLSDLDHDAQAQALSALGMEEACNPFDLSKGPLIRGRLLRLSPQEHVLLVTQHHIISDGWSTGVLVREVSALYTAFSQGQADPLPALPIQYADYAAWQRQWLQGEVLDQQLGYWREHLSGAPALLELPTDRPRPVMQSHAGGLVPVRFSAELTAGLHALSKRHGTTLFMTLLAGWSALLSRLSGQSDVVIGTPVANRQRTELEGLIGFFVNTLALRVEVGSDPTVSQLLSQVKDVTLGGYSHQDLPFEQVVEVLQPTRSLSHSPLFQVVLSLNNTPANDGLSLPGLTLSGMETPHMTTHFDLSLSLRDVGEGLAGGIEYASDLFDAATVARWAGHFERLLTAMVADADQRVRALPLLSAEERHQMLATFNDTAKTYPQDGLIHGLFEAQVARTPEATALVYEDQTLSYAELNRRANQVAHRLIGLGVKPDDRVAICTERSVEMVVGLLGILKAGGAYVPLDPTYPQDRLAYMLEDSAPMALLTQSALMDAVLGWLPEDSGLPVVVLDGAAAAELASQPTHDPDAQALGLCADHLAYVIYTSGSTGKPKGALNAHRGVVNRLLWAHDTFALDGRDRVLQKTTFGFDVSVWEFFLPLLAGARLVMARPGGHQDPVYLIDAIERHGITILHFVPSMLQVFLARHGVGRCRSLRDVKCSGEALPHALQQRFFEALPWAGLHNLYGPTEAAVDVTYWRCTPELHAGIVPIGKPVANTRTYILDAQGEPVPVGVVGELFLAGVQVGRGYLNRPELTAERFIQDPFSTQPDARMYKTGDLGRWLPDGNIEYLGRNDFQVKIRGFRIELGEIEAKLSACAGVREAVVLAREDVPGDKRLVAYVVPDAGVGLSVSTLRDALSRELAEYMVPSAFVSLEALPLTPNGKLDRRALPAPDQSSVVSRAYEAPVGEVERTIAEIWQELLGLERVGRHDHFFELGGHSLLAVQSIARLRQALSVDIGLRELFAEPTLSALARTLSGAEEAELSPIPPADRGAALPLSWAQQRLWFLDQLDHAAGAAYHMPSALKLDGVLDRAALQRTLDRVVARHENLRTTLVTVDGMPQQVIAPEDIGFALMDQDLSDLDHDAQAQALATLGMEEARNPFDLSKGPLIRGRLLRLSPQEHVLLVTQHHIISDGWSTGVLVREVSALYTAFSQGQADPLPALPIQYADYAAWQRQWLQGEVLDQQLGYWREHLSGAPALLELPTDRPRPVMQSHAGGLVPVRFSAELTAGLHALSKRHGTTLFMTLLAGWSALLSRLSGQSDVVIGTPVANRQRTELEGLIGFFVNTLALRVEVGSDPTVAELLSQVKDVTLGGYSHQDLPFEQVVEALQPTRSLGHSPLFQAMLSLNNTPSGGGLSLPGLTLSPLSTPHVTTHFDLSLYLNDGSEGLVGAIEYASGLFDAATVTRWAGHFERLLTAMVADADQRVRALPLLSAEERHQMLAAFNDTAKTYPQDGLIHGLFEAQVARTPEATALVHEAQTLSYAELNRRANQVAHRLIGLGVKPDDRVAICTERSVEMVVGLLGVLKAGGAYVPLDPTYPRDRLAYMLEDSAPMALLTQSALMDAVLGWLPEGSRLPVLVLDDEAVTGLASQPTHDPDAQALGLHGRHLAYVIYTSGSTGRPKGVMVHHQGLCNYLEYAREHYLHDALRGALVATPFGFDATVTSLMTPWLAGKSTVLLPEDSRECLTQLLSYGRQPRPWLFKLTPAHLDALAHLADAAAPCSTAHRLVVGGEQLTRRGLEQFRARAMPAAIVINEYGPTETVVGCTTYVSTPGDMRAQNDAVPIGRPLANTQIYILDERLQPVPLGVIGELYIGGAGVARGYLNRPELTAERFIKDPFNAQPDARMYKTGDLGRWLPDGNIEYLGRNDFQVKIRGFRIELGEIEAKLQGCAGVREAVVLAREDVPGEKRLVGYVVPDAGVELSASELRDALSRELAEYMVPSAFVTLEALPLTPNGKLDRKALPAPDQSSVASRAYEAPVGEVEQTIAEIWQELLGLERVGRHDHFFELGGHSLLLVQLMAWLNRRFDTAVPLIGIYRATTVRDQALLLAGHEGRSHSQLVEIQAGSKARCLFFIHPVGGDVLCYRHLVRELEVDDTVYGIQHEALTSPDAVSFKPLEQLADEYCVQIRKVQPRGPYRLAGWSLGGVVALAMAQRLEAMGEKVSYLGMIDSVIEHSQEAWLSVQEQLGDTQDLSAWMTMLRSDSELTRRFDAAHRLDSLPGGDANETRERLRAIILAGVIAARAFRAEGDVGRLAYYSALQTTARLPAGAEDRLLAMSREPARSHRFDADHFSLMQMPAVGLLAQRMRADLSEATA